MPYPMVASLAGTVKYSNGTLFDGYVLLLIAPPPGYTSASIMNQLIVQPICDHVKVRIQQGVYDQSARIYYTSYLEPPNCQYVAYFYDNNDIQLGHTALFTVTANPYTITVPALTIPSATSVIPSPGGGVLPVLPTAYWYPTTTPPDGTITNFSFPFNPSIVLWNWTTQLEGYGYTKTFNGTSYVVTFVDAAGNVLTPGITDSIIEGVA